MIMNHDTVSVEENLQASFKGPWHPRASTTFVNDESMTDTLAGASEALFDPADSLSDADDHF